MSSTPEKQAPNATDLDESGAPPHDRAWLIALVFVGTAFLLAVLFTIYVLAWDGGAHT